MSAVIADLDYRFQPYAELILGWLKQADPYFRVTSTRRSASEQAALRAAYVAGNHPLTVAPVGCSKHQLGLAVDIASSKRDPLTDPYLAYLGKWWRSVGGEWGGEADPVHFALPGKIC